MARNTKKLLSDKHDVMSHDYIFEKFSWIFEEDKDCIISPDSDGIMCALLMSHYLNWKVKGFYDGKVMLFDAETKPKNCIFLDMEIANDKVKSLGQHFITPYKDLYEIYGNGVFENCLSPNHIRGFSGKKLFSLKFPMSSVHYLISILSKRIKIKLTEKSFYPLLFVDGLYNVSFKYPENVMNWFNYLRIDQKENPLHELFFIRDWTFKKIMGGMDTFFEKRNTFSAKGKRDGDKLVISDQKGQPKNIIKSGNYHKIDPDVEKRYKGFIKYLAECYQWNFKDEFWAFDKLNKIVFDTKTLIAGSKKQSENFIKENVKLMYEQNLLSLAMIYGNTLTYSTLGSHKDLFD